MPRNCEIINMKQEKQVILQKFNEIRSKMNVLFKNQTESMQDFKLHLKTALEVKLFF
jgi:hypothetical protein